MSGRYYCDYCEKSFIDDVKARKRHLRSALHLSLRHIHYQSYRDPKVFVQEESAKTPCRRFMQTGDCQFGESCKYSHYTKQELWDFLQKVEAHEQKRIQEQMKLPEVPDIEPWLTKYRSKNVDKTDLKSVIEAAWTYPAQLEMRTDLPPSISKFRPEDFVDDDFAEWGE